MLELGPVYRYSNLFNSTEDYLYEELHVLETLSKFDHNHTLSISANYTERLRVYLKEEFFNLGNVTRSSCKALYC